MTILIAAVLTICAVVWLLPAFVEILTMLRGAVKRAGDQPEVGGRPLLLFLVPAHNEERMITACVRSLLAMRSERSRHAVVVIADNCTDATADNAARSGARVLERHNVDVRGKPVAIQWAMEELGDVGHEAVVIIDADTVVDAGFADALGTHAPVRDKVLQAYFGVLNPESAWLSRLGHLLTRVRYEGQYVKKRDAGVSCPLTGNGMCIGRGVLERVGWPSTSLTENWELYARCVAAGVRIDYEQNALLFSEEADSLGGGTVQRRRWQMGRWDVARLYTRAILRSRVSMLQKLDALVELAFPGPVVHFAIGAFMATLANTVDVKPAALLFALSISPIVIWTVWAWATSADRRAVAASLLRLPAYAVWRMGVWLHALVGKRSNEWVRSPRPGD